MKADYIVLPQNHRVQKEANIKHFTDCSDFQKHFFRRAAGGSQAVSV